MPGLSSNQDDGQSKLSCPGDGEFEGSYEEIRGRIMKKYIASEKAAAAGGAYSPGLQVGDFVFVSGQGPLAPETGEIVGNTIEEQTARTLDNVKAHLEAGGVAMDDVVKCTVHLSDINNFNRFNEVYATYFSDPKPTRTTVQSVLWPGLLVEIDAIAHKESAGR